jgi:uncharacterized protein YuzE
MTVTIGSLTFDHASYDSRGDVLYLHVARGEVIGLTIINAKWLLERDHVINVTVPEHVAVPPETLAEALAAA